MTKVVINNCYGGFGLSAKALEELCRRKQVEGIDLWSLSRADPDLVAAVENLGMEANGPYASLSIVEVPAGTHYRVEEYDGNEWLAIRDEMEWEVAE